MSPRLDDEFRALLAERHGFASWRDRATLDVSLFLWRWAPADDLFPDWALHRSRRIELENSPPFIEAAWKRPEPGTDRSFTLQVYECDSRSAARETLLERLGQFMSPLLERRDDFEIGDVAFAVPGDAAIVFARANLVVFLANAGSHLFPISEVARHVDADLIHRPEQGGRKVVPDPGEVVPLLLDLADPSIGLKFFSSTGEVFAAADRLMYRAATDGPQEVVVFEVPARGSA